MSNLIETLASYVPSQIVGDLARNPAAIAEAKSEQFLAAVLFADISGFSKLAEKLQRELGEGAAAAETLSSYVGKSLDVEEEGEIHRRDARLKLARLVQIGGEPVHDERRFVAVRVDRPHRPVGVPRHCPIGWSGGRGGGSG